ncbi:hypothetical protein C8J57DRAFT_1534841 [Mycena rebaudengoi]|nr:hypothetical protein C8J57DRAFT_1534841 [Mycena rebaudengoi]
MSRTMMVEVFFSGAIATLVLLLANLQAILLAGAVSLVSWTSCVLLIVWATKALKLKLLAEMITLKTFSMAANSLSAATDVMISVVLVLLLQYSKTGFRRSTDLINRLMVFTFNTGLPTSVCALATVVCVAAFPNTLL